MATKRSQAAWLSQLLTEWAGTDVVVAGDKVRRKPAIGGSRTLYRWDTRPTTRRLR